MPRGRSKQEGETTLELARLTSTRPLVTAIWSGGSATVPLPENEPCIVGRGRSADIDIPARSISRSHARLFHASGLMIQDLESANGTRLRGHLLLAGKPESFGFDEPILLGDAVVIVRRPLQGVDVVRESKGKESLPEPASQPVPALHSASAISEVDRLVSLVAPSNLSVLFLGETGAGKGYFAKLLHDRSRRADGPWLHLNCAALPENLLESELFGFEKGAFSGATQAKPGLLESASGGTVFLDEIGDLPAGVQAKLLVAIERREALRLGALKPRAIDVRLVSATNKSLDVHPTAGLRPDLYYRLAGLPIVIPPLRERAAEIPALVARFVAEAAARADRAVPSLSAGALHALSSHVWPGNVRELATVIDRALIWCGDTLLAEHLMLPTAARPEPAPAPPERTIEPPKDEPANERVTERRRLSEDVQEIERKRIVDALQACTGNQSRAARMLGIARRTLITKMIGYGIPRPRKG